jgi:hypothetical protein
MPDEMMEKEETPKTTEAEEPVGTNSSEDASGDTALEREPCKVCEVKDRYNNLAAAALRDSFAGFTVFPVVFPLLQTSSTLGDSFHSLLNINVTGSDLSNFGAPTLV